MLHTNENLGQKWEGEKTVRHAHACACSHRQDSHPHSPVLVCCFSQICFMGLCLPGILEEKYSYEGVRVEAGRGQISYYNRLATSLTSS